MDEMIPSIGISGPELTVRTVQLMTDLNDLGLCEDVGLVSDQLYELMESYPDQYQDVFEGFEKMSPSLIVKGIEGILLAFIMVANQSKQDRAGILFEKDMLDRVLKGAIFLGMISRAPTSEGYGRLSRPLKQYCVYAWSRLGNVLMTERKRAIISFSSEAKIILSGSAESVSGSLFESFVTELAVKFFLAAPLEVKLRYIQSDERAF